MAGVTMIRDNWIVLMEKRLTKLFCVGMDESTNWKSYWDEMESDKRREEFGEYVRPDVVEETPEGHPYVKLSSKYLRTNGVIHVDYTGYIEITKQMKRDNKMREIENESWGLGDAIARKVYEDAVKMLYGGLAGTVLSSDGLPWFSTAHPCSENAAVNDSNLITTPFGPQGILDATVALMKTRNEHGKPAPMLPKGKVQVIVPAEHWQLAEQLADKGKYLPNSNNFNENKFEIDPIIEPYLSNDLICPEDWRDTQYYVRASKYAQNYFISREGSQIDMATDPLTKSTIITGSICYSFHVQSHRGIIASRGLGA